ncbi:MAG: hypothetical protein RL071_1455 [Pseudomonadota bacterium]
MASPSEAGAWAAGPLRPRFLLALACALAVLVLSGPLPVLDEESYLEIGAALDPLRPYDWWRPWPPWGSSREPDAFVYAHPPGFLLWVAGWLRVVGGAFGGPEPGPALIWPLKVALAMPWAGLWGWAVGRLCERWSPRPALSAAAWLTAPVSLLVLQRGLMPDLMATALATAAATSWIEGRETEEAGARWRWGAGAGALLAAATLTKYPAGLVGLALLADARRPGRPLLAPFVMSGLGLFLLVEGYLWLSYGRPHLVEVLSRAGELPRGPLPGRALGLLSRLPLALLPLPLLWVAPARQWGAGALLGGLACVIGLPEGSEGPLVVQVLVWAAAGGALCSLLGAALSRAQARPDRLLAQWALLVVIGVLIGHNYVAPRYLAGAVAPLALLLGRAGAGLPAAAAAGWAAVGLQLLLGLGIGAAERTLAEAADEGARWAADARALPGRFTGEWTFRWRLRQRGWTFWDGASALPPGATLAAPTHSSPAALPAGLEPGPRRTFGAAALRVVDAPLGVGLYSETIGAQPLGWRPGPAEEVQLHVVPDPGAGQP